MDQTKKDGSPTKPRRAKTAKSSLPKVELSREGRIEEVSKWILSGRSPYDVREAIKENFPGDDSTILIEAAMKEVEQAAHYDPDRLLGWCVMAAKDLHRRMVEIGDFPGALRAVKQIMDMRSHVSSNDEEEIEETVIVQAPLVTGELRQVQGEAGGNIEATVT